MGDPRARSELGPVGLGVDGETDAAFGELDWEPPEPSDPVLPDSASRPNAHTRQTLRREDAGLEPDPDSTHIFSAGAARTEASTDQKSAPSTSHVAANQDRVAAMRELYARGDADAALALANAMEAVTVPPPAMREMDPGETHSGDHPDASLYVEMEMAEIDLDAFGGLIPIDEEERVHERDVTRIAMSSTTVPPAPMLSSLTERHGIPRVLLSPQEIARLPIDHRAGFLLGFIDGMQTMEEILDVCAMPPGEALDLIRSLVDMGVITIE